MTDPWPVNGVRTWVTQGVFTRIDHVTAGHGTERAFAGGSDTLVDASVVVPTV